MHGGHTRMSVKDKEGQGTKEMPVEESLAWLPRSLRA